MNKTRIFAAAMALMSVEFATDVRAQSVGLVETQGAWGVYADQGTPKKVCFLAAQPQSVEPKGANRGPIYFYVSAWPKDGVAAEPSVKVGYPINGQKDISITVGSDGFKLFAKGDRAFISEPAEEQKLIESMKKGATAVVKATSTRGTDTTDTYSLSGVTAALAKLDEVCK